MRSAAQISSLITAVLAALPCPPAQADAGSAMTSNITVDTRSSVSTLSSLDLSSGTLNPVFTAETSSYSATVPSSVQSITLTPTASDNTAKIKINGSKVSSRSASNAIPLAIGVNTIPVVVTAQDGVTVRTYSLAVTRISDIATLSNLVLDQGGVDPPFQPASTGYTLRLPSVLASLRITPTLTDNNASLRINGVAAASGVPATVTLSPGGNTVHLDVTAQDATTTKAYAISVDNTDFGVWKGRNFTRAGELGDPATGGDLATPRHDGVSNLMKYAIGLDPSENPGQALPFLDSDYNYSTRAAYLTLSYRRSKSATGVSYHVQAADSPAGPWSEVTTVTSQHDFGSFYLTTVRDSATAAAKPRRFLRLVISR